MCKVTLTASNGSYFKGFFFQARTPGSTTPLGAWSMLDAANQNFVNCSGVNTGISHNFNNTKNSTMAAWTAPSGYAAATVNLMCEGLMFETYLSIDSEFQELLKLVEPTTC